MTLQTVSVARPAMSALKRAFRRALRNMDPGDTETSDKAIHQNLVDLPEYQDAASIFCYYSIGTEPNTHGIIADAFQAGKRVFLPRPLDEGIMEAVEVHHLQNLHPGKLDIPEPVGPGTRDPLGPDCLIIVPALAFDRKGYRLGHGGGYYDRYLTKSRAVTAGICRERFLMDALPVEPHDVRVHVLVTDKGIARP